MQVLKLHIRCIWSECTLSSVLSSLSRMRLRDNKYTFCLFSLWENSCKSLQIRWSAFLIFFRTKLRAHLDFWAFHWPRACRTRWPNGELQAKQNCKKNQFFTRVESNSGSWSDQGRMRGQVFERVCLPFSQLRPCQARVSPEQGRQVHQTQRLCGQTGGRLPGKPVPIR